MGDMHVVVSYSGWKDFGGVMAPSQIVQTRGKDAAQGGAEFTLFAKQRSQVTPEDGAGAADMVAAK